jgi:hypothetical protein
MTARLEVELAIKQLPEGEIRDLAKWFQDYLNEMWDRQIEADLASGKLDRLIAPHFCRQRTVTAVNF